MLILHKVAYNSEEKARFKLWAISEPREKVIPTGSQCEKRESWNLREVEAKQDLRNQECMMRTMGQIIAPATVLGTPRSCCVIGLGQHFRA